MKCRKVRRSLVLFLDGELSFSEREAARVHLAGCEGCRREAEQLRSTLAAAVDRARQKQKPTLPADFASLFWERERERGGGRRSVAVGGRFSWVRERSVAGWAVASILTVGAMAVAVVALFEGGDRPSPGRTASPAIGAQEKRTVSPLNGHLARIEKELEELEAAVGRLRVPATAETRLTGKEMREVYAAIGLAAAKNYRDVLRMEDMALERYARVASLFPDTEAGREAEAILSGLN
jgi:hypothetical protein